MKDKWDLRFIYKDEAAFEKDLTYIKEVLTPKMASFQGKLQDEKAFSQFLALERESQKVFTKLYLYAGCASDQNKKDVKANERHGCESCFSQKRREESPPDCLLRWGRSFDRLGNP
jgi:hypothetical protein